MAEAVAGAARLLDHRAPGWARRIDTTALNMASLDTDVLGQLYGDYVTGLHRLGLQICPSGQRGFNLTPRHALSANPRRRFNELTAAWIREIQHHARTPEPEPGLEPRNRG